MLSPFARPIYLGRPSNKIFDFLIYKNHTKKYINYYADGKIVYTDCVLIPRGGMINYTIPYISFSQVNNLEGWLFNNILYDQNDIIYNVSETSELSFNAKWDESTLFTDTPLTFTSVGNSSINLNLGTAVYKVNLEYSLDGVNYSSYTSNTTIELVDQQSLYMRAVDKNETFSQVHFPSYTITPMNPAQFYMTGTIKSSGNIQTLLDKSGQQTNVPRGCFCGLFMGCTSLIQAPYLPATTLDQSAYQAMFYGCTNLSSPIRLPATSFNNTISSTSEYYLGHYIGMFYGCNSLKKIHVDFDDWYSYNDHLFTKQWVQNISSTGTFKCKKTLSSMFSNDNIPTGWTVVKKG